MTVPELFPISRQVAGEALRRFQLRKVGGRPKRRNAPLSCEISRARNKRGFRTGNHQVGVIRTGVVEARRQPDVVPVLSTRPGNRLLSAAAANHQHPHQAITPSNANFACASPTASG